MERGYYKNVPYLQYQVLRLSRIIRHYFFRGIAALNMGFRSSGIIGMKISDIDWKNRSIRIFQQKTEAEHLYPMDIKTGNAIYRYLKDARRRDTSSGR